MIAGKRPGVLRRIKRSRAVRTVRYAPYFFRSYYGRKLSLLVSQTYSSPELSNFTYDLTEKNLLYLAHTVSVVTGVEPALARSYLEEARHDSALRSHLEKELHLLGERLDPRVLSPFGRRLGWYAVARARKPSMIVETGVERGHGALLLCAALLRNQAEGRPGRYYGTDIDPRAGRLLTAPYASVGKILYGDSIESLWALDGPIGLFINDSDHSADYEYREYHTVAQKLASDALVLGDNAHVSDKLALFSAETSRNFLFFREEPKDHWYPGAGIGFSFR